MNVIVNQPVRRLPHTEHTRLSDGLGLVASDTNGLSISQDFLQKSRSTGCSLNIVFFSLKILSFFRTLPVLLQRWWCSTCLVCVHTHDTEGKLGKQRKASLEKF